MTNDDASRNKQRRHPTKNEHRRLTTEEGVALFLYSFFSLAVAFMVMSLSDDDDAFSGFRSSRMLLFSLARGLEAAVVALSPAAARGDVTAKNKMTKAARI